MSDLTTVKVLARMKPGCAYAVWELSTLLGLKVASVRPVVEKMATDGLLISRVKADRHRRFYIAGTEDMKTEKVAKGANVATPLIPILMTGELSGYDAGFTRNRNLCMSIRRAA